MSQPRLFFPVALNFEDWPCAIVGGGDEAEFKTRAFNQFGKAPTVIAEHFTIGLQELGECGNAKLVQASYSPDLLDGVKILLACSEDEALNLSVGRDARSRGILFNMVDNADISDFIASSFVRRGNITVNVMTDALSPAFANSVRNKIARMLENNYQAHLKFFVETKLRINKLTNNLRIKKRVWRELVDLDLLGILENEGEIVAVNEVDRVISDHFSRGPENDQDQLATSQSGQGSNNED